MGWLTDYLEKLSLIDHAASKMNPVQKPPSFAWKPFSRKEREACLAEREAQTKQAEERFAREKAQREEMYAEQCRLHAERKEWADEMRKILEQDDRNEPHEESDQ